MKPHRAVILRGLILATFALPVLAASAGAQEPRRGFSLDLDLASLQGADSGAHRSFGLRSGYRFSRTWALEGSLSRPDGGGGAWLGDLSAKLYVLHASLFELYALGGPGRSRLPFQDEAGTRPTLHLGIGAEISLVDRAYLRPEFRQRWDRAHVDGNGLQEYSLGLGWKF